MLLEFLLVLPAAMLLASQISSTYSTGRYYIRLTMYFILLFVLSAAAFPVCFYLILFGDRYDTNYIQGMVFYYSMSWLFGITVEVEGEEYLKGSGTAVLLGNHQTALDVFCISRIFPKRCTIMAKKELKYAPLLGQWMSLAGTIFVDRANSKNAMKSLDQVGSDIKDKSLSIFIFPEGTRTSLETPGMLPFKKGAFHIAVKAGVPLIPIVTENYWRLFRKGVFESGKLKIKVLPPIPTTGLTSDDVNDLSTKARNVMMQALKEISMPVTDEVAKADAARMEKIINKRSRHPQAPAPSASTTTTTEAAKGPAPAPEPVPVTRESGSTTPRAEEEKQKNVIAAAPETPVVEASSQGQGPKDSPGGSSGGATDDEMVIVDRPN